MKKWNVSLTYQPKIRGVMDGTIRQTIRKIGMAGEKWPGDLISFHGWSGRPYRSPWSWRLPYTPITFAEPIRAFAEGIQWPLQDDPDCGIYSWDSLFCRALAQLDGIYPATGQHLKTVLMDLNKIPEEGILMQIIRW